MDSILDIEIHGDFFINIAQAIDKTSFYTMLCIHKMWFNDTRIRADVHLHKNVLATLPTELFWKLEMVGVLTSL